MSSTTDPFMLARWWTLFQWLQQNMVWRSFACYIKHKFSRIWMVAYLSYPHINVMINRFPLVDPATVQLDLRRTERVVSLCLGVILLSMRNLANNIYIYIIYIHLNNYVLYMCTWTYIYIYNCWMLNCQLNIQQKNDTHMDWNESQVWCCKSTCRLAKVNIWEDLM